MTLKYEILKRLVKAANIKKMWTGMSTEELLENRRKQNAKKGDFTNCPKTTFIYGSDETLYACAPSFEAAMNKYKVDYEMIIGEGMFHCYPVFPICKEAKDGWNMMVQLMKGEA